MRMNHLPQAICLITLFALSSMSQAETMATKNQLIACTSESVFGEMRGYETNKDQNGVTQLMRSGLCVVISPGEPVTILRPGILTATISYQGKKFFTRADTLR